MKEPSDPVRLGDDTGTPERLAEALRLARGGPDSRSLSRLSGALGVVPPLAPPPVPPASGLAAVSGSGASLLGLAGFVGAVGVGAAVALSVPNESTPPPPRAPVIAAPAPTAERPEPEPEPARREAAEPPVPAAPVRRRRAEPEPAASASAAPAASVEPPVAAASAPLDPASRLKEEARLVRTAERLLGSEPARALALTEERRRRFPGGALDQEAEVVAIDALLRLGQRAAASARGRAFEARHPGSVHARRVRALLGSPP